MTVHIYWRPVDSPGEPFTHIGECEGVAFEHGEFKAPGGLLMVTPRPHDGWCGRGLSMLPGPNDGLRIDLNGIHRSSIYPLLEWWFCSDCAKKIRDACPAISDNAVKDILQRWSKGSSGQDIDAEFAKRRDQWADIAQQQYVAAECIAIGAIVGRIATTERLPASAQDWWTPEGS